MADAFQHERFEKREEQRLDILATDLANAYAAFLEAFPNPATVTIANFGDFFHDQQLEYLLYAGTTGSTRKASPLGMPYSDVIVQDLLQLSAAYLYLPVGLARPHVRLFGLMLCYYFFATQPQRAEASCVTPARISVAVSVLEDLCSQATDERLERLSERGGLALPSCSATPKASSTSSSATLLSIALKLKAGGAAAATAASPSPSSAKPSSSVLTEAERIVFVSLHKYGAWQAQPYERIEPHLRALTKAHEALGAAASLLLPLQPTDNPKAHVPLLADATFTQRLDDYQRSLAELGL